MELIEKSKHYLVAVLIISIGNELVVTLISEDILTSIGFPNSRSNLLLF